ncbi:MAG: radical SAM protein [Proteobacteria bacterium]|nr:radical SAM protein [Pseudomonadota bacterium]
MMSKVSGGVMKKDMDFLAWTAKKFFRDYGTPKLLGREPSLILKGCEPEHRFDLLLSAWGYGQDANGFFHALAGAVSQPPDQRAPEKIVMNAIPLPILFLYRMLEVMDSSNALVSVKTIDQLANRAGLFVGEDLRDQVQQVLDLYPVRLSDHVIRQSKVSRAVALQYLPSAQELDPRGHTITFDGHFKKGLLEQMYQNRVIFLLDMRCPVYCRFCFRKHKSFRREKSFGVADVKEAVDRVKDLPGVKEILITGGEPLLNRDNMEAALTGLMEIDHVNTLRIATRSIAYYPLLFLKNSREYVSYLKSKQAECIKRGKGLEIGVHFVHPDEVSLQSLEIISDLVRSGIPVYVQTPFLNRLNNSGPVLARLFTLLRNAGAQIYYIFTPCHPIHGTQTYWTPISQSMAAHRYLRAHLSDRCIPKLCTATPLGKMEWHTSGWAVAKDTSDPDHIWIRTPYTREYFASVTKEGTPGHDVMENSDGTLNVKCLIDMGDTNLFLGNHSLSGKILEKRSGHHPGPEERQNIKKSLFSGRFSISSLASTPSLTIARVHKTRAELHLDPNLKQDKAAISYIRENPEITDVILHIPDDGEAKLNVQIDRIRRTVDDLCLSDHLACIRIRWKAFQSFPQAFTPRIIDQIAGLANFSIADPLKIEMETWWLVPGELLPAHGDLVRKLACRGIQTYANLALISGLNDDPMVIAEMAHGLRRAGITFHHVYAAGLAVQNRFNRVHPIETDQVLAIASHVRKVCSGREIPLYMIQTSLGEVDFGLTSTLVLEPNSQDEKKWFLRLEPYSADYFRAMDPGFTLSKTEARDVGGTLMVPIIGLARSGDFSL